MWWRTLAATSQAGARTADQVAAEAKPAVEVPRPDGLTGLLQALVERPAFQNGILTVIVLNSIVLGIDSAMPLEDGYVDYLHIVDRVCLSIFVVELVLKFMAYRWRFFTNAWNVFDFAVVAVALVPDSGGLAILRAFRIFRALKFLSVVPSMRRLIGALVTAIPSVLSTIFLLALIFYIGGVMATNLFGAEFPVWFGDLWRSLFSLFQIMTLESWASDIVRPIMETAPYAWAFFVPFILIASFTALNLFIGIIVDAMRTTAAADNAREHGGNREETVEHIHDIKLRLDQIDRKLGRLRLSPDTDGVSANADGLTRQS
jgi:voltage-gated sodium channel